MFQSPSAVRKTIVPAQIYYMGKFTVTHQGRKDFWGSVFLVFPGPLAD
jgi:hypothetical protein